jgi:hypothetical protein
MCSCDYLLPNNYRCAGVEKDEISWSVPLLDVRIACEKYLLTTAGCKRESINHHAGILVDGDDQHASLEGIFSLESCFGDFGVWVACSSNIIFFLTSLFIDSIHQ